MRGFRPAAPLAHAALTTAGNSFLDGFEIVAGSRSSPERDDRLQDLPSDRRGFAFEGAGMAAALLDGLPATHGNHLRELLEGPGWDHEYMVYVGAGWALARLPRFRWASATTALTDPVLCWLALDGYGFHQAYFRTSQYLENHAEEREFPWPRWDRAGYAQRAIDQGIGRALWFVEGADRSSLAARIATFRPSRQGDLYAGVGLAATYAAGVGVPELADLVRLSGPHHRALAQGCVFAATARLRAANVTQDTIRAVEAITGLTVAAAAEIAESNRPSGRYCGEVPAYEAWRQDIMSAIGVGVDSGW